MDASPFTVLHYLGYDTAAGGIFSVVRSLADTQRFDCMIGVNRGFTASRRMEIPAQEFTRVVGEQISPATAWRTRFVAREVRAWLAKSPARIFHGHSRAGLLVALWLRQMGERRVVVSVHCYGRHRWFYRWAAGKLGDRLFWLSPAMKQHYGVGRGGTANDWSQCIPGCVPPRSAPLARGPRDLRTSGRVRLAGIGSIVPWKRWDLVLEGLAALPVEMRARLHFTHIGAAHSSADSQRHAADLRVRTAALKLDHQVEWRGEQPSAEGVLRESDALIVVSEREPLSIAMIEALTSGVPVLAADSGGARDIITPPHNGWLFRSGDSRDLARMFRVLVESAALEQVQIDESSLQRFSAPVVADRWLAVYRRVLGNPAIES